ncbi:MAG TPA: ribosome silencing factor [Moraxellaceae bacterium]|nr:ribosome silencing factor [Moraxellaceae bacterium]
MKELDTSTQQLVDTALAALADLKAKDVVSLDVRPMTSLADVMVIASGTSTRHVKSLADNVVEKVKEAGFRPLGMEGERDAEWILIDLAGVIVHVMLPATRAFYDLERLWTPAAPAAAPAAAARP